MPAFASHDSLHSLFRAEVRAKAICEMTKLMNSHDRNITANMDHTVRSYKYLPYSISAFHAENTRVLSFQRNSKLMYSRFFAEKFLHTCVVSAPTFETYLSFCGFPDLTSYGANFSTWGNCAEEGRRNFAKDKADANGQKQT